MKPYVFIASILVAGLLGCVSIDSSEVRARAGAPEAARVDRLEIPYDSSLPRFALVVETFMNPGSITQTAIRSNQFNQQVDRSNTSTEPGISLTGTGEEVIRGNETTRVDSQNGPILMGQPSEAEVATVRQPALNNVSDVSSRGTTKSRGQKTPTQRNDTSVDITQRSWDVYRRDVNAAAQFTSSLSGVGNFLILSPSAAKSVGGGIYRANLPQGAIGPFIIKALVTEEVYEVEGGSFKIFIPGLVSRKWSELQGVVILDITVLDGRTGALVTAFPTEGTFISQDKRFSAGIILPLAEQRAFARSVASQAQRVALNQATERIIEILRTYQS
jgi:hypothetical protein